MSERAGEATPCGLVRNEQLGPDLEAGRPASLDERISMRLLSQEIREASCSVESVDITTPDPRAPAPTRDVKLTRRDIGLLFNSALVSKRAKTGNSLHGTGLQYESQHASLRKRKPHSEPNLHGRASAHEKDESPIPREPSERGSSKASGHNKTVDWRQEVDVAAEEALVCEISEEDRKIVEDYCRSVNRQKWFHLGSVFPGKLGNVNKIGSSRELKQLDPEVLGSFPFSKRQYSGCDTG